MNYLKDYTEKEQRLFNLLGLGHLTDIIDATSLYRIAVEKVFIENSIGEHVESLRRCYKAISQCNPYRHTKEFEDLINV